MGALAGRRAVRNPEAGHACPGQANPNPMAPTPPPPPETTHASRAVEAAGAALIAAERAIERRLEERVAYAERTLARRLGPPGLRLVLGLLRTCWIIALIAYFAFGAVILATRYYVLPHIGDWRPDIALAASSALHAPVTIGAIEADWEGLRPRLRLRDVTIQDARGQPSLALGRVDAVLSWTSLLAWEPRLSALTVAAPQIQVRRLRDLRFDIGGFLIDPQAPQSDASMLDWLLAQGRISVLEARVHFIDEAAPGPDGRPAIYDFSRVDFVLARSLTGHRFSLQLRPPEDLSGSIDLRGQFRHAWGQPIALMASWSGKLFVQVEDADLARLNGIVHLVPAPARLDQAHGAMRAWMDFAALRVTHLRADVALNGVEALWRPDLDPMRLDQVQGRISQTLTRTRDGETEEIALIGLSLDGPEGMRLPPTDLLFLATRTAGAAPGAAAPQPSRFEASHIVLGDWSRLAREVPLPPSWLGLIERTAARGTLDDLQASWEGSQTPPRTFHLHTRFSGLGFTLNAADTAAAAPPAAPDVGGMPPVRPPGSAMARPDGPAILRKVGFVPLPGNAANAADSGTPAVVADPAAPGDDAAPPGAPWIVENLAGSIDLTQDSGSLHLDSPAARLRPAAIFGERTIALATLAADLRWSRDATGRLQFDLDSLAAANDDLDLRAYGSLRHPRNPAEGATRLELGGRLARARVATVWEYLPDVLPAAPRAWLRAALLDGTISDGTFQLRGDPARFPFSDPRTGDFRAEFQLHDGRMDVAPPIGDGAAGGERGAPPPGEIAPAPRPRWPELTGIEGSVSFERDRFSLSGRRARAYGFELSNITATIPRLGQPNAHLSLHGQGAGSGSELLRYVVASPVNAWTGSWMGKAQISGPVRLGLNLEIPLAHAAESAVAGNIVFEGDSVLLRSDIPPLAAVSGQLDFTQRGIRMHGMNAVFLGGDVRVDADTKADGAVLIQGSGTATPQGARPMMQPASLRHLLDKAHGQFRYTANLSLQRDATAVQIDSDLLGLSIGLPPPFRKAAAEPRAMRVEIVPVAGAKPARDTVRVSLADALDVELHRIGGGGDGGEARIERGVVAVGTHASLPENGLLLVVDQPEVDADRWEALLMRPGGGAAAAPGAAPDGSAEPGLDAVVLRAGSLTGSGKTITNVSLSARHDGPNRAWNVELDADQASGALRWVDTAPAGRGRLTARLAKLSIPERDKKQVSELLSTPPTDFPELDIVADDFSLGTRDLGRLELTAQSSGDPAHRVWNLTKLTITNPDGNFSGSGAWQRDGAGSARRMDLNFALNYSDAGGLLERFGLPNYVRRGSGRLDGDVSWLGTPFTVDFPTLSGTLKLSAEKGQLLKIETGAGRLLAVFSLESIWHVVTGDLREFSAGVPFDSIHATASINRGILSTDDFLMKGTSGAGRIKGTLDLHAQTQNLEIVVVPEVNASGTAILTATFLNPAVGLSTLIGSLLLNKPLSAVLTKVFSVTGPWSDPQIKTLHGESAAAATAVPEAPPPAIPGATGAAWP